jgi:hypothetical protein
MRILSLSEHCCIRVVKQTMALSDAGHDVTCLCKRNANPDMTPILPAVSYYRDSEDLVDKIPGPWDVIHVHNEPSALVSAVRATGPACPVVFDCHDLDACRYDLPTAEEAMAFVRADAAVFPSEPYRRVAHGHYRFAGPTEVVYSWPTADMVGAVADKTPLGGLVYEGGAMIGGRLKYCDYRQVAARCASEGIPLTMFGADARSADDYMAAGALYLPPMSYMEMLTQLTRYDYGLCAPGAPSAQWQRTIPNKLWEYIAAGLPVICWGADATAEKVIELGVGEVLDGPEQLTAATWARLLARRRFYAAQARRVRADLVMERQTGAILDLYRRAAEYAAGRPAIPSPSFDKPEVSVVTGSLNRLPSLLRMVASVRNAAGPVQYEIVVVDGGSTDGTGEWAAAQSDVRLVQQGKPLGITAAYNAGFAEAAGKFVLALNDDARLVGTLPALVSEASKADHVMIPWRDPGEKEYHVNATPSVGVDGHAVQYGNFAITRKAAGDEGGWWPACLPNYGGDCELSLRLKAGGFKIAMSDACRVDHDRAMDGTRKPNTDCRRWQLMNCWRMADGYPEDPATGG